MKSIMMINQLTKTRDKYQYKLAKMKRILMDCVNEIETEEKCKYTGWFVLLNYRNNKWEFVDIYNPDEDEGDEEQEWDLSIPIPEIGSVPEFKGW